MNFNKADILFAFAMLICGFLYWNLLDFGMLGAGVTLFAMVIFTVAFVYMLKSGYKQNIRSIICLILATLSALQFTLFDNRFISFLNFMFLMVLFIYWVCLSTSRQIDKKLSVYILGYAVKQGIRIPFMNFPCCVAGIKRSLSGQKKGKGILAALIGILIFFPLIAAVVSLLMSADWAFENFVGRFYDLLNFDTIVTYIGQFIFGIPVAFYLYGLIYGNVKGRNTDKVTAESVDRAAEIVRIAPKITIYSALTVFNMIYIMFFAVQAAYLFSAFSGDLPETFTYADYARRGFFELCAVAGINLLVLTVSYLTIKKGTSEEPKALRAETAVISVFTILLIATALSKMAMYISAYGLTQLRVFTSWFMVVLFIIFLVICVRQFIKFNSAKVIILGFVIMFMVLSYGNTDGLIAKYNIEMYEAGSLKTLDITALYELSDAAVSHVYDLYRKTDDMEMRQKLESYINYNGYYGNSGFREFNFQRCRADAIRNEIGVAL